MRLLRGIVGLTTAYALVLQSFEVTILDEAKDAASASKATAGIIAGSTVVPWAKKACGPNYQRCFKARIVQYQFHGLCQKTFYFFKSEY